MSKVDELRKKYPNITTVTFNKFVNGDITNTKKYLPFMLKAWANKKGVISTSADLIKLVNMFDELLPYIENKDIYNKDYENIRYFVDVINKAIEVKEEKTFVREDHINVLLETDDYIFLQPKTHKGSLVYGAQTRWCTASKNNPGTFDSYRKAGSLVYLIDKKGDKGKNYEKVAFFDRKSNGFFNGGFEIFNAADSPCQDYTLLNNNWSAEDIFKITSYYRYFSFEYNKVRKSINEVEKVISSLRNINFDNFKKNLKVIEKASNYDYISDAKEVVEKLLTKIKID